MSDRNPIQRRSLRPRGLASILAVGALLAACGDGGITTSDGELRVRADRIDFPRTFVGYPTEATLLLENTGRGAVGIRILVDAPFSADGDDSVSPGEQYVVLRFSPPAPGHFESSLVVDVRGETRSVLLVGDAEAVPDCASTTACRTSTFDPAKGRCVEAIADDGASCTAACLEASFCRGGECIGAPKSCDDGNACTTDACDPELGCVNVDHAASCAAPTEKCRAAFCDPKTGCGVEVVPDGTLCGAADCVSAHVCLAGSCQVVATPEGTACGEETPCRSQGRCRSGSCDRPAATVMQPVWSYEPRDRVVTLTGSVDETGALYAYSATAASSDVRLVSFTTGGIERWSQPLERAGFNELQGQTRLFTAFRSLVLNTPGVEVRRTLDGARTWAADPTSTEFVTDAAPVAADRYLGIVRRVDAASGVERAELAAVDPTTGGILTNYPTIPNPELGLTDGAGRHVLRHYDPVEGFRVVAIDPSNAIAWTKPSTFWPAATLGDVVLGFDDAGAVAFHATNGNEAYRLPLAPPDWKQERRFVGDRSNGYALSRACDAGDCAWGMSRPHALVGFDPSDGSLRFEHALTGTAYGALQLTSKGTVLVLEAGQQLRVSEYGVSGDRRFECAADVPFRESDTAAFLDGLLVVGGPRSSSIRAYRLPGLSPATSGWVSERGSVARDSRPLR